MRQGLPYMLEAYPLGDVLAKVFHGSGEVRGQSAGVFSVCWIAG